MTWVAFAAIGFWVASIGCFVKGGFASAFDGLHWMFLCFMCAGIGIAFTLAAVFA